ncbi:MAG: PQQ-binding-like beta-propeller repeat protein [Planctomycetota bacterium]|nr:MAG: PQQ-binding-like beta-propeller repeat protein [Planctomycetota bacterium]
MWTPQQPVEAFGYADLVSSPLCSADLRPLTMVDDEEFQISTRRNQPAVEFPYLYPLVSGDTVYTNDGLWISAWDRFTLTPKWRTKPRGADYEREDIESMYASAPYRRNRSRDAGEVSTLAKSGRLLLAATGIVTDGTRSGDPRLHAFDSQTGRVLWSTYIDELDPQLDQSSTRGPALVEGDTAIVAVRKIDQARRFASAFLVGIDLADGSLRWVRLCGSAGWLAYGNRGQWSDWPTLHQGVVYRVDELGVICARRGRERAVPLGAPSCPASRAACPRRACPGPPRSPSSTATRCSRSGRTGASCCGLTWRPARSSAGARPATSEASSTDRATCSRTRAVSWPSGRTTSRPSPSTGRSTGRCGCRSRSRAPASSGASWPGARRCSCRCRPVSACSTSNRSRPKSASRSTRRAICSR